MNVDQLYLSARARLRRVLQHRNGLVVAAAVTVVIIFGAVAAGVIAGIAGYVAHFNRVDALPSEATRVYAGNGELIASFYRENRAYVPLTEIPRVSQLAVLATEDDRFYRHHGVDGRAILRALWRNLRSGHLLEGGSTITQQLARSLYLSPQRTFSRKFTEMVLALEIERRLSKDEILERYLNLVYFGHGAYGIEMAAQLYFDKPVRSLNLAESALLAGLIRAPSLSDPFRHPDLAVEQQRLVLIRMAHLGYIGPTVAHAAMDEPLHFATERNAGLVGMRAPYFATTVLQYLVAKYGEDLVYNAGLQVYTTLDPRMQDAAQRALRQGLDEARRERLFVGQGALVALEPQTGFIRAMVGGYDFNGSQFNRAWQARRQVGSAFKPFIYTAAVEAGWRPWKMLLDAPVTFVNPDGSVWRPENYDRRFRGWVTMRSALERSINIPAVRTIQEIGPDAVVATARRMGITSPLVRHLALALGSSDVTPLEMAAAYGTLAAGGLRADPIAVTRVLDRTGRLLEQNAPRRSVALDAAVTDLMISMLKGVIWRGTGRAAAIGRPAAGKTGTSDDFRNAWFIGFTPHLSAAVWVGNDDNSPMKDVVGGSVPARVWASFMRVAADGTPPDDWARTSDGAPAASPVVPPVWSPPANGFWRRRPRPSDQNETIDRVIKENGLRVASPAA